MKLGDGAATATVGVRDRDAARKFYEGTLGLTLSKSDDPETLVFNTGGSTLLVYRSQYAGTNEATAVTWLVGDAVDEVVRALKAKGVTFEHYDMPETKREGDIHIAGGRRVAWFKDPDGNIHSIVNG
ncbi:MAG: VOC family protein [Gemmatimonadaceae bacterium]